MNSTSPPTWARSDEPVTPAVLERKGFLEIVADEHDARSKRMQTTKQHRKFWAKRNPQDHACVVEWLSGLDEAETATLVRLLGKAITSARAARAT